MARIHPKPLMLSNSSSSHSSSERETFTVWMKSLVIHGNGCTVFNAKGEVVFRVDNYQSRSSSEVLLMNFNGDVLFSIKRKKQLNFKSWKGHRWTNSKFDKEGEWFSVKRSFKLFGKYIPSMHVVLGCNRTIGGCCKIEGLKGKSTLKIVDCEGQLLAEVIQKQSSGGNSLGDDVLSLVVEPQIDQSLVVALVVVYGMINSKL